MGDTDVHINLADEDVALDEAMDEEEDTQKKGGRNVRGAGPRDEAGRRIKGRGANDSMDVEAADRYAGRAGVFETISGEDETPGAPARSVEGWIVFITGVHEEAQEEDIHDKFAQFGVIKNMHLPLDRRTGFVKGYALVEYANKDEAERAIASLNGSTFINQTIHVDWAFCHGAQEKKQPAREGRRPQSRLSRGGGSGGRR